MPCLRELQQTLEDTATDLYGAKRKALAEFEQDEKVTRALELIAQLEGCGEVMRKKEVLLSKRTMSECLVALGYEPLEILEVSVDLDVTEEDDILNMQLELSRISEELSKKNNTWVWV